MSKKVLITGATDGIGLETSKRLVAAGHHVLIHGRSESKLAMARETLSSQSDAVESYLADLSNLNDVDTLAEQVRQRHDKIDVLINNAGVLKTANPIAPNGIDVRFMVNTLAPYRLTRKLQGTVGSTGRVVNVSSAAQAPVNLKAMAEGTRLDDMDAYAQSKLAITMWTMALASEPGAPMLVAVNPGSLLASKMVKEGFGIAGSDLGIGADILFRAAVDDEFEAATGRYFDNDSRKFASPHADASDPRKIEEVVGTIEQILASLGASND